MKYSFFRDFFYDVKSSIEKNAVTFILGPRKCGKTVCLKQLDEVIKNTEYIDFKHMDENERQENIRRIRSSVFNKESKLYLLDEITYLSAPELFIYQIADWYTDVENSTTKIVIAGSQSVALETWANRAYAGNAGKIKADFLTYSEFLRYKGIKEISAETYNKFLYETSEFYNIGSLKDYLSGCIDETIISNANSSNYIQNNDCELIQNDLHFLVNVCYQTLFTLHNQASVTSFFRDNKLADSIINYFRDVCNELEQKDIADRIQKSFIGSYSTIKSKDIETLKQALTFLRKCDLIRITPVSNDIWNVPDVVRDIQSGDRGIGYKAQIFKDYNITIKYPMFYIQILKDILNEDMPAKLPKQLLGSIVECHARGLLPEGFEFRKNEYAEDHSEITKEIDYVNLSYCIAIELTISRKHATHFDLLPDYIQPYLLTRDRSDLHGSIKKIPYYYFLYALSEHSKNLLKMPDHKILSVFHGLNKQDAHYGHP